MIDTVLLEIQKKAIPENLHFFKSVMNDDGFIRQYCNPDAKFVRSFGYTPSFTIKKEYDSLRKTWEVQGVTIHASLPKLLYGTNYYGIDETDYDAVVDKLVERSKFVELPFEREDIEQATLKQVDFCFNLFFPDSFAYPIEYLKRMVGLDAGKVFSGLQHKEYVESKEGFSIGLYNGRVGVGFYDKKAQLENQAKTREETMILVNMDMGKLQKKILRMEVRWQNQRAVKQHLYTLLRGDKNQSRHLQEVFDNDLAQSVLYSLFEKVADSVIMQALWMPIVQIEETIEECKKAELPLYDTLALIGQAYAIQSLGANRFAQLQDKYYSRQTRSTTKQRIKRILDTHPLPVSDLETVFAYCKEQLEKFDIMKSPSTENTFEVPSYNPILFAPS